MERLSDWYKDMANMWRLEAKRNRQENERKADEEDSRAQRVIRQFLESAANAPEDKLALLEQVKQAEAKANEMMLVHETKTWPYIDVVNQSDKLRFDMAS